MRSSKRNRFIDVNGNGIVKSKARYDRAMPEKSINNDTSYLYTFGKEYTTIRGDEWIGEYHMRKGGIPYTGAVQSTTERDDAIMLLPYYESNNNFTYDRLLNFQQPLKDHSDPIPWEFSIKDEYGEYQQGFTVRYFVQRIGPGNYAIEIDQTQRDQYASAEGIDNRIYKIVDLPWRLTGTLAKIEEANKAAVSKASLMISDLPFIIRNYTQYARPTTQTEFGMLDAHLIARQADISPTSLSPGEAGPPSKLINTKTKTPLKRTYDPESGLITPPTQQLSPSQSGKPGLSQFVASTRRSGR